MSLPVIVRELAKEDIQDIHKTLEQAQSGLGDRFAMRLHEVLERIDERVQMGRIGQLDVEGHATDPVRCRGRSGGHDVEMMLGDDEKICRAIRCDRESLLGVPATPKAGVTANTSAPDLCSQPQQVQVRSRPALAVSSNGKYSRK